MQVRERLISQAGIAPNNTIWNCHIEIKLR